MKALLHVLAALAVALVIGNMPLHAADFPTKPIRMIVGYAPGAATDFSARVVSARLSTLLGQPVIVENRPGAAWVLALQFVSRSAPDGYTLLWGNGDVISILPAVKPSVPYKIPDDLTAISRTANYPFALAVSSKLGISSLADFVAYAKANPGKLRYGSSGVGGALHVTTLLIDKEAGIEMTHVPYSGAAPMMTDLLGGFIDVSVTTLLTAGPPAKAGSVRLLAVTSENRDPLFPDLPTLKESGYPGATVIDWFGVFGPPAMPADVVDRLSKAIADALADPDVKRQLATSDLTASPLAGNGFKTFIVDDLARWQAVAKSAHIEITE